MRVRRYLTVVALLAATLGVAAGTQARGDPSPRAIAAADLPKEARVTLERIRDGRTLPYDRDGVIFGNRERMLPAQPHGYYHEYTVKTPGVRNRGARRIVCGGHKGTDEGTSKGTIADCYYSDDHYQSFKSIRP